MYLRAALGQEVPWYAPPPAEGEEVTEEEASSFADLWNRFLALWPDFYGMAAEIQDYRSRWSILRQESPELAAQAEERIGALNVLEGTRRAIADKITELRDAWDQLAGYLTSGARWFGLQGPGLGLPPLVLLVGIPALILGLTWVVNTYLRLRAELDGDRSILEAAEAGRISPQTAVALAQARRAAPATTWSALQWVAVIGLGLVVLQMVRPGGGR